MTKLTLQSVGAGIWREGGKKRSFVRMHVGGEGSKNVQIQQGGMEGKKYDIYCVHNIWIFS